MHVEAAPFAPRQMRCTLILVWADHSTKDHSTVWRGKGLEERVIISHKSTRKLILKTFKGTNLSTLLFYV